MLSRRTLVSSAAALPALTVPALAMTATVTTLPPDLIERFVRVRAWFLDLHEREERADYDESEDEVNRLTDERWAVAEEMLSHQPQTIVDLAWQAEAYLLTDLELFEPSNEWSDWMIRAVFQHIRTLGALPQPADPFGALTIAA